MGSVSDHKLWSSEAAELARKLASSSDPILMRWAPVAAYYAVMHSLQAVAAEKGEQRTQHEEIIAIPADHDLPKKEILELQVRELYRHCNASRYLRGSNKKASEWFKPFATQAEDLINESIRLMEAVLTEL